MTINTARGVAAELKTRLSQILLTSGCETNIGAKIFSGRTKVSDDEVQATNGCISLIEDIDTVGDKGSGRSVEYMIDQRYSVVAYVPLLPDEEPNDGAHRALADIKRAIFAGDASLGRQVKEVVYRGRDIGARQDGVNIVLAVLAISVIYVETLWAP